MYSGVPATTPCCVRCTSSTMRARPKSVILTQEWNHRGTEAQRREDEEKEERPSSPVFSSCLCLCVSVVHILQQYIGWLDVPMNQPLCVRGGQAERGLQADADDFRD